MYKRAYNPRDILDRKYLWKMELPSGVEMTFGKSRGINAFTTRDTLELSRNLLCALEVYYRTVSRNDTIDDLIFYVGDDFRGYVGSTGADPMKVYHCNATVLRRYLSGRFTTVGGDYAIINEESFVIQKYNLSDLPLKVLEYLFFWEYFDKSPFCNKYSTLEPPLDFGFLRKRGLTDLSRTGVIFHEKEEI